jgi:hypothetical protein
MNDEDRRTAVRRRALKAGKIVFNDGASVIDCTVRDLSETGARVLVDSPLGVPPRFVLDVSGTLRPARVVWRKAGALGVAFDPAGE